MDGKFFTIIRLRFSNIDNPGSLVSFAIIPAKKKSRIMINSPVTRIDKLGIVQRIIQIRIDIGNASAIAFF